MDEQVQAAARDRMGAFRRSDAYDGWERSLFPIEWFDSRPERTVANIVDGDDSVTCWVRLHINELPILWNSAGREYNPDLLVLETGGRHVIVEIKADKDMATSDVTGKRDAARRWVNHVNADDRVTVNWDYLIVSESDIDIAKGSWSALMRLGAS